MKFSFTAAKDSWRSWWVSPEKKASRWFCFGVCAYLLMAIICFLIQPEARYSPGWFWLKSPLAFFAFLLVIVVVSSVVLDKSLFTLPLFYLLGTLGFATLYFWVMWGGSTYAREKTDPGFASAVGVMLCLMVNLIVLTWVIVICYYPCCNMIPGKSIALLVIIAASMTTAVVFGYGVEPKLVNVELPIKGLAKEFDNFSICMIADTHIAADTSVNEVVNLVDRVNQLNCDLILLNGDIGEGQLKYRTEQLVNFKNLKAPQGVFFTFGNHEYYNYAAPGGNFAEAKRYGEYYKSLGNIKVLDNEHVRITKSAKSIVFAGLDDVFHNPNLDKALKGVDDSDIVVLAHHNPANAKQNFERASVKVQLSGHTHGGQVFPLQFVVWYAYKYFSGLYCLEKGKQLLYVSDGTYGSFIQRQRFGSFKELTVVKLRTGEHAEVGGGVRVATVALVFAIIAVVLTVVWIVVRGIPKLLMWSGVLILDGDEIEIESAGGGHEELPQQENCEERSTPEDSLLPDGAAVEAV